MYSLYRYYYNICILCQFLTQMIVVIYKINTTLEVKRNSYSCRTRAKENYGKKLDNREEGPSSPM